MHALPSSHSTIGSPTAIDAVEGAAAPSTWVVCLCAEWCGACREYRGVFEQVAQVHPGLRFAWVDVEDHAELADDFDVETFPTLLIAGAAGTHFLGPLLPHAETLARMLTALPAPQPAVAAVNTLLAAMVAHPATFVLRTDSTGAA